MVFEFFEGFDGAAFAIGFGEVFGEPVFEVDADGVAFFEELGAGPKSGFGVDHDEVGFELGGLGEHFGAAIAEGAGGGDAGKTEEVAGEALL